MQHDPGDHGGYMDLAALGAYAVIIDRGSQFSKDLANTLARLLGYRQSFTSPYTPQTNAKLGRSIVYIGPSCVCKCLSTGEWVKYLQPVLFAVRTAKSRSTGETPFLLVRGSRSVT